MHLFTAQSKLICEKNGDVSHQKPSSRVGAYRTRDWAIRILRRWVKEKPPFSANSWFFSTVSTIFETASVSTRT